MKHIDYFSQSQPNNEFACTLLAGVALKQQLDSRISLAR